MALGTREERSSLISLILTLPTALFSPQTPFLLSPFPALLQKTARPKLATSMTYEVAILVRILASLLICSETFEQLSHGLGTDEKRLPQRTCYSWQYIHNSSFTLDPIAVPPTDGTHSPCCTGPSCCLLPGLVSHQPLTKSRSMEFPCGSPWLVGFFQKQ